MKDLTARQRAVLDVIARSIASTGKAPTLRAIGSALDIRSVRGTQKHVDALVKKGMLIREPYKPSGLSLPAQ